MFWPRGTASSKPELIMTNPLAGRSVRILLPTACLALVLASCGDSDGGENDIALPAPAATEVGTSEDSPPPPEEDDASLSLVDAAAKAVKAVDNSSLLNLETEEGRLVWEATVVTKDGTEHEMMFTTSDGEMLDGPTKNFDDAEDKRENRALIRAADLSYKEAARAISDAVPDAKLMELNLDQWEDRITAWEGDLYRDNGIRYSVTINAKTGDVLEKDADAEDDD